MNHDERRLAIRACQIVEEADFVYMSWEFKHNVPDEMRAFLDHYFGEWIARDWYTTVQHLIEEDFDISQKEIDEFTDDN